MLYNLTRKYGDYMRNKKGFVLTETLVVTVFLVTISTFVYVSIVPLMGRYDDMIDREKDIDIVYKLYNLRKLLIMDDNRDSIIQGDFNGDIKCSDFAKSEYCNKLLEQMEISNYRLIYVKNIYNNLETNIKNLDNSLNTTEFYNYLKKYSDDEGEYLVLLDLSEDKYTGKAKHTMAHLLYAPFIQTY